MTLSRIHCTCYHFDMLSIGIRLTVDSDCLDTQLFGGSHDANSDFTSVIGGRGRSISFLIQSASFFTLVANQLTCWQSRSFQTMGCDLCTNPDEPYTPILSLSHAFTSHYVGSMNTSDGGGVLNTMASIWSQHSLCSVDCQC